MYEDIFNKINIPGEERKITKDLFELVLERVLKNLYLSLSESDKKKMNDIFLSQNQELQEEFITTHLPNLEDVLYKEMGKIESEIKKDITK